MAAQAMITTGLSSMGLALTPIERWQAARGFKTSAVAEHWFVIVTLVALIVLVALLCWVTYSRMMERRKIAERLFSEATERRGLAPRERHLLLEVISRSGLKVNHAIFAAQDAFERGAAHLIEERLKTQQPDEETDQLKAELALLRDKLGFQPQRSTGAPSRTKQPSSQQIPVGKTVHVTRRKARSSPSIESLVLKNTSRELIVKLATPIQSRPGDYWHVRYHFDTSVLEFDTSVIRSAGDILVLNHSDNVQFVSRRRFTRVPVDTPALIAHFPLSRTLPEKTNRVQKTSKGKKTSSAAHAKSWGALEFVPAVITELAGPGLRMEAPLNVEVGDRVLIVFRLEQREDPDTTSKKGRKTTFAKIVQDTGIVRHTQAIKKGVSIAVELTGLGDTDIDELIYATDAVAPAGASECTETSAPASQKQTAEQEPAEVAAAQGA